ncbi:MAG: FkbM family methyltransferase [Planctomycetota bacterium]
MALKPAAITTWIRYQYRKLFRPRVVDNGGLKIYLGDQARTRYARSIYRDTHEAEEREIVARNLAADDIVLECGAGLGVVTTLCCQQIGSDRVYSFEANRKLEPTLRKTFSLNQVSPHLEMTMVSLKGGAQDFYASDRFVVSSRYDNTQRYGGEQQTLESVSIQSLIDQLKPSFLIMDIEGAEVDLADEQVDLGSLEKLCIEMHPHIVGDDKITALIANLIRQGFQLRMSECRDDVMFFSRAA